MAKNPAFLFYSQDFLIGCADLTMEERGQYITLLCLQHQKGHISDKSIKIAVPNISADVLKKFIKDCDGNYYNERLALETRKRDRFTESRRKNLLSDPEINLHTDSHVDLHTDSLMENENENRNSNKKMEKEKESLKEQKLRLLEQRRQVFAIRVFEFSNQYPKEMLDKFLLYWSEMNKAGSQMRWEMERTWELSRRLATWASREKGFNRPTDMISYKELVRRYNDGETDIWERYEQVTQGDKRSLWRIKK